MGGVHRALVRVLRGHFSLVARPCTCERRNQCECQQAAPVGVAMVPPRCVGQGCAPPVCAKGALEAGGGAASAARDVEGSMEPRCRPLITPRQRPRPERHRCSVPPLHAPSRRGSTSASLQRTLCAHASGGVQPCPTRCGGSIATPTGAALALTLVAVFAGARARHQREMASQDSHERPVPHARPPPPSQRGPHLS